MSVSKSVARIRPRSPTRGEWIPARKPLKHHTKQAVVEPFSVAHLIHKVRGKTERVAIGGDIYTTARGSNIFSLFHAGSTLNYPRVTIRP